MTPKKQPVRRCMGCNEGRPKKELVRIVRSKEGEVSLDRTGKKPGRGAYVCPKAACLAKARKTGRIARALECPIPDEVYDVLLREIAQQEEEGEAHAQ